MKTVLHVGCGQKTIKQMPPPFQDGTWREIRLDIDPRLKPDVIGSLTDLGAVESGSMDALFSSHSIEHIYPHEVPRALAEFRRVLNPSGFALITCPNLQVLAPYLASGRLYDKVYDSPSGPVTAMDILFGHIASVAAGSTFMAHRGGFTQATLTEALQKAGFGSVGTGRRLTNLWAIATSSPLAETHMKSLMEAYFPSAQRQPVPGPPPGTLGRSAGFDQGRSGG